MPESVFNTPSTDDDAIKALRKLLTEIETSVPAEQMAELRNTLTNAFEEEFNAGYRVGAKDGAENATVSDKSHFLKGEAKGLMWAYHAINGRRASVMDNPYANQNIMAGLLALGGVKSQD